MVEFKVGDGEREIKVERDGVNGLRNGQEEI